MTQPTISVLLTTYNSARFIREQLDSLLSQTDPPEQIVIGDDGSTDGTVDIVHAYAQSNEGRASATEWRVLPPGTQWGASQLGSTENKRRVFDACTGDVVVNCDSDDVNLPQRIEWARRTFGDDSNLLLTHGDAELITSRGTPMGRTLFQAQGLSPWEREAYRSGEAFKVLARRQVATGATFVMRRSLYDLAGEVPQYWKWDAWYAFIAAALDAIQLEERPTILYRQHESNVSGVGRSRRDRIRLLGVDGGNRRVRQLARAETAYRALSGLGSRVQSRWLELTRDWLVHEQNRSRYPSARALRLVHVVREARSGRYGRAARGKKDILLDLVQPLSSDH